MKWLIIITAGVLSGAAASLGIGGGGILIIFLTLIFNTDQLISQGINLLFFIPIAVISIVIYAKQGLIKFKNIIPIVVFGLLGVAVGMPIATLMGDSMLRKIFGIVLAALGIVELFKKKRQKCCRTINTTIFL